jgi:hypothetical protein
LAKDKVTRVEEIRIILKQMIVEARLSEVRERQDPRERLMEIDPLSSKTSSEPAKSSHSIFSSFILELYLLFF